LQTEIERDRKYSLLSLSSRAREESSPTLTCDIVAKYARSDDAAVRAEQVLQVLLGHVLWQAAHVQVGPFDGLAAGSCVRHLPTHHKLINHLYTKKQIRISRNIDLAPRGCRVFGLHPPLRIKYNESGSAGEKTAKVW
jgi:hypothetical protein